MCFLFQPTFYGDVEELRSPDAEVASEASEVPAKDVIPAPVLSKVSADSVPVLNESTAIAAETVADPMASGEPHADGH